MNKTRRRDQTFLAILLAGGLCFAGSAHANSYSNQGSVREQAPEGPKRVVLHLRDLVQKFEAPSTKIISFSGDVMILRINIRITPKVGMELEPMDRFITGEGAYIDVAFDDGLENVSRISDTSDVMLQVLDPPHFHIYKGNVFALQDNVRAAAGGLKISTPSAVTSGSAEVFEVGHRETTTVSAFKGTVSIEAVGKNGNVGEKVQIPQGFRAEIKAFESLPLKEVSRTDELKFHVLRDALDRHIEAAKLDPAFFGSLPAKKAAALPEQDLDGQFGTLSAAEKIKKDLDENPALARFREQFERALDAYHHAPDEEKKDVAVLRLIKLAAAIERAKGDL